MALIAPATVHSRAWTKNFFGKLEREEAEGEEANFGFVRVTEIDPYPGLFFFH